MNFLYTAAGFADGEMPQDWLRSRTFEPQPSQLAAKDIVRFSPSLSQDAAYVEADRKLASGETLLDSAARLYARG